jgi:hypothetical protein
MQSSGSPYKTYLSP